MKQHRSAENYEQPLSQFVCGRSVTLLQKFVGVWVIAALQFLWRSPFRVQSCGLLGSRIFRATHD